MKASGTEENMFKLPFMHKKDEGFNLNDFDLPSLKNSSTPQDDGFSNFSSSSLGTDPSTSSQPPLPSQSPHSADDYAGYSPVQNSTPLLDSPMQQFSSPQQPSSYDLQSVHNDISRAKLDSMEAKMALIEARMSSMEQKMELMLNLLKEEVSEETKRKYKINSMMNNFRNS